MVSTVMNASNETEQSTGTCPVLMLDPYVKQMGPNVHSNRDEEQRKLRTSSPIQLFPTSLQILVLSDSIRKPYAFVCS